MCLFHQYQMTWSTRKQYYLSLWAFSQLKSMYIYIFFKTDVKVKGLHLHSNYVLRHSIHRGHASAATYVIVWWRTFSLSSTWQPINIASCREWFWVISNMAAITTLIIFCLPTLTRKEYEIITLIYNRKTCRIVNWST